MSWMNKRIEVAKEILEKTHYATGSLAKPKVDIKLEEKKIVAKLLTEYYWDFINSGVKGLERQVKVVPNLEGIIQSFKTPYPNRNMVEALKSGGGSSGGWIASKGIPVKTTIDDLAYAIATNIKKRGIEANEYINIAFSPKALEELFELTFEKINEIWQ
jgi:hypothetical protein